MSKENLHKIARDRFVAFAFASADFLLEIDKQGKIVFSAGKVVSLTGVESLDLVGHDWLGVFADNDKKDLQAILKGVQRAGRVGPVMVHVVNKKNKQTNKAMVMGMTIPESPNIFLTLNTMQAFFDFLEVSDFNDSQMLNEKQFEESSLVAFAEAKRAGQNLDVTFLEADELEDYKNTLSLDEANNFNEKLNAVLKEQSYEGKTASQLDKNKYAIIHNTETTPEFIENKIQELIKTTKPGSKNLGLKSKTLEADMGVLNEREARRALIYTMNQMEENGIESGDGSLADGFDDYLQQNASKISSLKKIIGHQAFKLNFQPIVYLGDKSLCHYEALVRFDSGSPYELIVFAEDIGLAPDVDISILRHAIGYIQSNIKETPDLRIAVNVSGQSIQSEKFFDAVLHTLDETKCQPENLLFEITESTAISDLETVNKYIQKLRDRKFEVCLDDFGAGAASFQYLNALDIDCVKIDGKYVQDALKSSRDEAMVRNLVRMCRDLGVTTVAEMVETEEQFEYLRSIGVEKAQGWLFGKPQEIAEYSIS